MKYGDCIFCGLPAVVKDDGVSHHIFKNTDKVNHEEDADHVAVLEEKDLNNPKEILPADSQVEVRLRLLGTMQVADFKETMAELADGFFEVMDCAPVNILKGMGTVRLSKEETTFLVWMLGYAHTELEKVAERDPHKHAWMKRHQIPLLHKIGAVYEKLHKP